MKHKFHVGQKVRIVESAMNPANVGRITFIVALPRLKRVLGSELMLYELEDNGWASEECLAPVYDGDEKSNWSECDWKPQTERQPISTIIK